MTEFQKFESKLMSQEPHFVLGKRLPTGTWTPWAQILCPDHVDTSTRLWKGDIYMMSEPRESDEFEDIATCDVCGREIWMMDKVAAEQRAVKALNKVGLPAHMQQTGGMCSACELYAEAEDLYMMVTAHTDAPEGESAIYWMGIYCDEHGDQLDSEGIPDRCLTLEEVVEHAQRVYEVWKNG